MRKKIIVIDCNHIDEKEFEQFQTHLFDNHHQWHSSKYYGERKYKKTANLLIIEDKELFNGTEDVVITISKDADVIRFNSPYEYTRHYKIKKLTTKMK